MVGLLEGLERFLIEELPSEVSFIDLPPERVRSFTPSSASRFDIV
jgi:hypothetical protein